MIEKLNNIVEQPFRLITNIPNFKKLCIYVMNNAPQRKLFKFLIRSMPNWKNYNKNAWLEILGSINNEIAFLNMTIFFGRYLKIDLINSLNSENINENFLIFTRKFLIKNSSILYLNEHNCDDETLFYLGEKEFSKITNKLLKNGFLIIEDINPPEIIKI